MTAECRDLPHMTHWWFPRNEQRADTSARATVARAYCAVCPTRRTCLHNHLAEPAGIFGGLDEKERAELGVLIGLPSECRWCDHRFVSDHAAQKYCTVRCRDRARAARQQTRGS